MLAFSGPQGPWWVDNANLFLSSFLTRQAEIGAKVMSQARASCLTTAFYRMRAPFFYPKVIQAPILSAPQTSSMGRVILLRREGRETHDGIEVNAEGKAANWLRLTASASAIRAISRYWNAGIRQ